MGQTKFSVQCGGCGRHMHRQASKPNKLGPDGRLIWYHSPCWTAYIAAGGKP